MSYWSDKTNDAESLINCLKCGHAGLIPGNSILSVCSKSGGHMKNTDDSIMFVDKYGKDRQEIPLVA